MDIAGDNFRNKKRMEKRSRCNRTKRIPQVDLGQKKKKIDFIGSNIKYDADILTILYVKE